MLSKRYENTYFTIKISIVTTISIIEERCRNINILLKIEGEYNPNNCKHFRYVICYILCYFHKILAKGISPPPPSEKNCSLFHNREDCGRFYEFLSLKKLFVVKIILNIYVLKR